MKIPGIKKNKPEEVINLFNDFKNEWISNSISKFTCDDFICYANSHDVQEKYRIVAYKYGSESEWEYRYPGCYGLNVCKLFSVFSNNSDKLSMLDDNGKIIKIINKIGTKTYEFIN